MSTATVLLVLGALPWTLVFVDNVAAGSAPRTAGGPLFLNLLQLWMIYAVWDGRSWARYAITVGATLFFVSQIPAIGAVGATPGAGFYAGVLLVTAALSAVGVGLLYVRDSAAFIAEAMAYKRDSRRRRRPR